MCAVPLLLLLLLLYEFRKIIQCVLTHNRCDIPDISPYILLYYNDAKRIYIKNVTDSELVEKLLVFYRVIAETVL